MVKDTNETEPGIRPGYKFRITADDRYITIDNGAGEKAYLVETLRHMEANVSGFYSPPVVDMARQALEHFGKGPKDEELSTMTLVTIQGIKVYQEWTRARRFFAKIGKAFVYRKDLSELEKIIRGK